MGETAMGRICGEVNTLNAPQKPPNKPLQTAE